MILRNTLALAAAAIGVSFFGLTEKAVAAAPVITYTASGTFASTTISGADTLKLAGEPFTVTISVSSATKPDKHGSNWGSYNKLKLTGIVHSGLLGSSPVNIASNEASITQSIDPGVDDQFTMQAPVKVVGISLTIKATVIMPLGTIPHFLLAPFTAPVTMTPNNATLTYASGTTSTVLAMESGTLTGTIPAAGAALSARNLDPAGFAPAILKRDAGMPARLS